MTPQEQQMIDGLISRIRSTEVQSKDTEAEQHLQQGLAGVPDALYVLAQTVLVQGYGLQQAQSQISELKQQTKTLQDQLGTAQQHEKAAGGSFLSHIFGTGGSGNQTQTQAPPPSSTNPPYQPVNSPGYGTGGYPGSYPPAPPPPPVYATQPYPTPGGGGGLFGRGGGMLGGGGGFLQGALQTAAGVAAGEMVFQGMEDLFHGFGGHGGGYGFGGGGMGGGETIINNYNDDDRGSRDRDFGSSGRNDAGFYNPGDDASRSNFADTAGASSDIGDFGGDSFNTADDTSPGNFSDSGSSDFSAGGSDYDDSSSNDFSSSDDNS